MADVIQKLEDLNGLQRVALVVMSLKPQAAGMLLKTIDEGLVQKIVREVSTLGPVAPKVIDEALEEFYNLMMGASWRREGGLEYAKRLLKESLEPHVSERIIQQLSQQVQQAPFAFLQKAESEHLLTFIQDEHPQTIALIISHVPHSKASEILGGLPNQKQVEVIKRIANMEQTNPEVVLEVERGLKNRLSSMLSQSFEKIGGVDTVAEMLNLVDRSTEKSIMEGLESEDPDLVEEIRRLMFVFEDVNLVDDKGIQAMLKEIDNDELALAMKTASDELKDKVFRNMSERASELIKEDMEYMGPVRIADVEAAQQRIVDVVRRLEDAGEIMISGRGGEKEMIV